MTPEQRVSAERRRRRRARQVRMQEEHLRARLETFTAVFVLLLLASMLTAVVLGVH